MKSRISKDKYEDWATVIRTDLSTQVIPSNGREPKICRMVQKT